MGCKNSRDEVKSTLFSKSDIKQIRILFLQVQNIDEYIIDLFHHQNTDMIGQIVKKCLKKYMPSGLNFIQFVRSFQFLCQGRTVSDFSAQHILQRLLALLQLSPTQSNIKSIIFILIKLLNIQNFTIPQQIQSIQQGKTLISKKYPMLLSVFSSFIKSKLFLRQTLKFTPLPQNSFLYPIYPNIYLSTPSLSNKQNLNLLYTSVSDGLSFNRMALGIAGYTSSLLIGILLNDGSLIGGYVGGYLQDSVQYTGQIDSFLFSFQSEFKVRRPFPYATGNFVYFNSKIKNNSKYPEGLGFGGDRRDFRLWLDKDIDSGSYSQRYCEVYENQPLLGGDGYVKLDIVRIEVWGCGRVCDMENQEKYRESQSIRISNNRKIDKKLLIQSGFNREYLLPSTFRNSEYNVENQLI